MGPRAPPDIRRGTPQTRPGIEKSMSPYRPEAVGDSGEITPTIGNGHEGRMLRNMTCPACGSETMPTARFCSTCGRALRGPDDERRIVTVLFADIVGFTKLSERLDPEQVKNLVDRCFDLLAVEVEAFGGQVDKIVG